MQHWIIDREVRPLPSWQTAMPDARLLCRRDAGTVPFGAAGIIWWRLSAGEAPPQLTLGEAQHLVLLCDEPDEAMVVQALAMGAAGCCNTYAAPDVLQQVALVVANGGLWIGQSLLQKLVGSTARVLASRPPRAGSDDWAGRLSEREAQVARLVAGAASNKEIAGQLSISERTVKAHLTSVFEKLGLRDRLQLSLRINGLSL
jgi:DNA-binding NarL/FixJ family response regulator